VNAVANAWSSDVGRLVFSFTTSSSSSSSTTTTIPPPASSSYSSSPSDSYSCCKVLVGRSPTHYAARAWAHSLCRAFPLPAARRSRIEGHCSTDRGGGSGACGLRAVSSVFLDLCVLRCAAGVAVGSPEDEATEMTSSRSQAQLLLCCGGGEDRGGKVGRRVSLTGNGRDKRYDRRGVPGRARRRELGLSHGVCIHAEGSLGRTNLYWVIAKGAKSDVGGGVRGRRLTLSKGAYMHTHAEGTLGGTHLYWALGLTTIRTNNTHLDVATRARHLIYLAFVYTIHETTACGQLRPCPQWRSPIPTRMVWT
jgi:hypothetical protein